jgi:hypothetical protein
MQHDDNAESPELTEKSTESLESTAGEGTEEVVTDSNNVVPRKEISDFGSISVPIDQSTTFNPHPHSTQFADHATMVAALGKPGGAILGEINRKKYSLLIQVLEDAVASGDVVDGAKKAIVYNQMDHPSRPPVRNRREVPDHLTAEQVHLAHMVLGIVGEAAELADAVLKSILTGDPLDIENIAEELGDGEFYTEGFRQGLGLNRNDILQMNIDKLSLRYAEGYSDQAAQERADKA